MCIFRNKFLNIRPITYDFFVTAGVFVLAKPLAVRLSVGPGRNAGREEQTSQKSNTYSSDITISNIEVENIG